MVWIRFGGRPRAASLDPLEAQRGEVDLLRVGVGTQRQRRDQGVGDLEQVAADDLQVGAVGDQAQIARETKSNSVVDGERKRVVGGAFDGDLAGAGEGRGGLEYLARTGEGVPAPYCARTALGAGSRCGRFLCVGGTECGSEYGSGTQMNDEAETFHLVLECHAADGDAKLSGETFIGA